MERRLQVQRNASVVGWAKCGLVAACFKGRCQFRTISEASLHSDSVRITAAQCGKGDSGCPEASGPGVDRAGQIAGSGAGGSRVGPLWTFRAGHVLQRVPGGKG
uniref:(northern house mosquito) hypothetical protein n=1 Tax=Culex pipiens TaxID=7175 RepID=A0A8D8BT66_CULPI